jgi:uncharacterized protein (UPF0128 family)
MVIEAPGKPKKKREYQYRLFIYKGFDVLIGDGYDRVCVRTVEFGILA